MNIKLLKIKMETKQVIVIRKDLKMRRGKEVAQGCHASMAFLTRNINVAKGSVDFKDDKLVVIDHWMKNSFKKVCLVVNSEEELLDIYKKAVGLGLLVNLVTDSGLTEFKGVPTKTCLAIGPDRSEEIDKVTGELKLY